MILATLYLFATMWITPDKLGKSPQGLEGSPSRIRIKQSDLVQNRRAFGGIVVAILSLIMEKREPQIIHLSLVTMSFFGLIFLFFVAIFHTGMRLEWCQRRNGTHRAFIRHSWKIYGNPIFQTRYTTIVGEKTECCWAIAGRHLGYLVQVTFF